MSRPANSNIDVITIEQRDRLQQCFDRLSRDRITVELDSLFMILYDEFGSEWNHDQVFVMTVMGMFASRIRQRS